MTPAPQWGTQVGEKQKVVRIEYICFERVIQIWNIHRVDGEIKQRSKTIMYRFMCSSSDVLPFGTRSKDRLSLLLGAECMQDKSKKLLTRLLLISYSKSLSLSGNLKT